MTIALSLRVAVEDELSGAVLARLIAGFGYSIPQHNIHNARGNARLKAGMAKFKQASRVIPHIVLTDLDLISCAPALIADWQATQLPPTLILRIAVREVEAWLLADKTGIAEFLHVDANKIPHSPEILDNPKQALINLARKSKKRKLARDIVPAKGSSAPIGLLYNFHFINFVNTRWNIDQARLAAPSLDKAILRIASFLAAEKSSS
jgi:hypothetical protein